MAVRCHPIVSRAAARTLTSATRIDMALAIEAQSPRHAGAIGGDPPWRSGGCECEEPTAPTDAGHGNAEATAERCAGQKCEQRRRRASNEIGRASCRERV